MIPDGKPGKRRYGNWAGNPKGHDERKTLMTALRRIRSLEPKNVEKYAQQIANEALVRVGGSQDGR